MSWKQKVINLVPLLPFALFNSAFKLGSISFIVAILRYNSVYLYGSIAGIVIVLASLFAEGCLLPKYFHLLQGSLVHATSICKISKLAVLSGLKEELTTIKLTGNHQKSNILFQNVFWFVVNCITIIGLMITFNVSPDTNVWHFFPIVNAPSKPISETPVGAYINFIGPGLILLGVISLALTFHQCEYEEAVDQKECEMRRYQHEIYLSVSVETLQ
jgi:hypothetical protein